MQRYRHMMVGLTRTSGDAGLIRYAAMVARFGTVNAVRFVHVLPDSAADEHDRVRGEFVNLVRSNFTNVPASVPTSVDVLNGPPIDKLLAHVAEREADLLLIGDHSGAGRRVLARRLAMKAPCSVWLVPEGAHTEIRRILVPIDFSESAADCIRVATSMARLGSRVECLALHVYFNEATVTYEGYDQVIRGRESEEFSRFVAPIDRQGIEVEPIFEEGANVPNVISRAVEQYGVDLVVMGTRGRSRSAAVLLGSVTEELIAETKVPLLAVKHFGARMSVVQALLDRRFWHRGELHT